MPRILVADDHEIIRCGLRVLLESRPGWQVVGEADNGQAALVLAKELQPNVAIIDLVISEMNGLELTRQLRQTVPQLAVLIFSADYVEQQARDAYHSGAKGYLLKTATGTQLVEAVEALHQGQSYFLAIPNTRGLITPASILSPREREVVQLLAVGHTSKDAAAQLGISPRTVDSHRAAIMKKLKLFSLAELVRFAIRNGLAPP